MKYEPNQEKTRDVVRLAQILGNNLDHCESCLAEAEREIAALKKQIPVAHSTWKDAAESALAEVKRLERLVDELSTGNCSKCGIILDACDCMDESEQQLLNSEGRAGK